MEQFPNLFCCRLSKKPDQLFCRAVSHLLDLTSWFSWYHLTCSSFSFISCKYTLVYNTVECSITYNTVTYMERESYHIRTQLSCPARTFDQLFEQLCKWNLDSLGSYLKDCCCSVSQSCLTLCDPMGCSMPGFPVLHHLPEFAQTHVHWVSDAIWSSHPLLSPFPSALCLSYHQGLFQWVGSSHQVAKTLEFQLQHQSFQWIFRTDFL